MQTPITDVITPRSPERQNYVNFLQNGPVLPDQLFMPIEQFREINQATDKIIRIEPEVADDRLFLPVANFVTAVAFRDWSSGRPDKKDGLKSKTIIKDYSKRSTPMPDLGRIDGCIQPNGLTIYGITHDGAHRVGAAIKRKDRSIGVLGPIILACLNKNYIEL